MTDDPTDLVTVSSDGGVRVVSLNRPEARNALSIALQRALGAALTAADHDPAVACIVLTGADPAFCAGLDLKELGQGVAPATLSDGESPFAALAHMQTPIIGAINGACATGGLELALACDFLIASERARFGDTHARVGFTPAGGMSVLLPQAVGLRKAREMSFTGNFVDAGEAHRLGLVNHVVAHDQLLPTAITLGESISSADQDAVRALKDLYDRGSRLAPGDALRLELEVFASRRLPPETIEARRAALLDRNRTTS
jgi:enoyl-CoA hydratase/carnithine racemase